MKQTVFRNLFCLRHDVGVNVLLDDGCSAKYPFQGGVRNQIPKLDAPGVLSRNRETPGNNLD